MVTLEEFNYTASDELWPVLSSCADVPVWVDSLLQDRPYATIDSLFERADALAGEFTEPDVNRALAAHPRIGERAHKTGTEAAWSRQEQAAASDSSAETAAALVEANVAYEERFGRVFLICATGLSAEAILASVQQRLTNDPEAEAEVVAAELRKIAVLRLRKAVTE